MNKYFIGFLVLIFTSVSLSSFLLDEEDTPQIHWYSFEEGMAAAKRDNKKVFVDVYTDWCGWCKKMDKTTFSDPDVVAYLSENYIAVKFDAESKETIQYLSNDYVFVPNSRNGYNQLAGVLLDNKLSFPSFVILESNGKRLTKSAGYLSKEQLITKLKRYN